MLLNIKETEDFKYSHLPDILSGGNSIHLPGNENTSANFRTEEFDKTMYDIVVFSDGKLSASLSELTEFSIETDKHNALSGHMNSVLKNLIGENVLEYTITSLHDSPSKILLVVHLQNDTKNHCLTSITVSLKTSQKMQILEIAHNFGTLNSVGVKNVYTIDDHAELGISRIVSGHNNICYSHSEFTLGKNAKMNLQDFLLGGAEIRYENHVFLDKENAEAKLSGIYLSHQDSRLEEHLFIRHNARNTGSTQNFRGIAGGNGTGIFTGHVKVEKAAAGTIAKQLNKGIIVSPLAEINARPILEILNDEVKCSHGNSIGTQDQEALFYLKSRGIDNSTAQTILLDAFIQEILADLADKPYVPYVQKLVKEKVTSMTQNSYDR